MGDRRTAHTRQTAEARMAARRAEVARLRLAGWTQQAIADRLGVTQQTVSTDVAAAMDGWRDSAGESMATLVAQDAARLDALLAGVWDEAVPEDGSPPRLPAVDRAVAILARRARLLGLDGQHTDSILTQEVLDREIARLERVLEDYPDRPDEQ